MQMFEKGIEICRRFRLSVQTPGPEQKVGIALPTLPLKHLNALRHQPQKVKHAGSTFGAVKHYLKPRSPSNRCRIRICPDHVCSYYHTSLLPLASKYYRHRFKKIFGMTHAP
jgi:hypothetical protein